LQYGVFTKQYLPRLIELLANDSESRVVKIALRECGRGFEFKRRRAS
jgi:hypothetical protein